MQKTWVKRNSLWGKTSQNYHKSFMFLVYSRLIPDCFESILRWLQEALHGSMPLQNSTGWARNPWKTNSLKKNSVANLRIECESRCAGPMFCFLLCITETYFETRLHHQKHTFETRLHHQNTLWFWINQFYCANWWAGIKYFWSELKHFSCL